MFRKEKPIEKLTPFYDVLLSRTSNRVFIERSALIAKRAGYSLLLARAHHDLGSWWRRQSHGLRRGRRS